MSKLQQHYDEVLRPQLKSDLGLANVMQIPKITKITVNFGVGEGAADKKIVTKAADELTALAGQKSVITKARKSIAGFKIRDGMPIGAKVTLRKDRMYDFLEKLLAIVLPRVRDFRGLNPRSFDGQGNYSLGLKEQIVFPEIKYDKIDALRGLDITITTTATNNEQGFALLKAFKFPFKEGKQ